MQGHNSSHEGISKENHTKKYPNQVDDPSNYTHFFLLHLSGKLDCQLNDLKENESSALFR